MNIPAAILASVPMLGLAAVIVVCTIAEIRSRTRRDRRKLDEEINKAVKEEKAAGRARLEQEISKRESLEQELAALKEKLDSMPEPEPEPVIAEWMPPHWHCDYCDRDFTLISRGREKDPVCCPFCNKTKINKNPKESEAEKEVVTYLCPHCGRKFETMDGDDPGHCPYCGAERPSLDDWAVHIGDLTFLKGYWICPDCAEEFRLDGDDQTPAACPCCGAKFAADKPNITYQNHRFKCRSCGGTVVVYDGVDPSGCPHCGNFDGPDWMIAES